jgi:hypothetical protein
MRFVSRPAIPTMPLRHHGSFLELVRSPLDAAPELTGDGRPRRNDGQGEWLLEL